MRFTTRINREKREITCAAGDTLFDVLRGLDLKGVKQGCDREGTCGACTVLLDGVPILSCITPAPKAAGREVITIEGLGNPSQPHPLQVAFVKAGAVQCGYCTPGMVLAANALLNREPAPSNKQIAEALSGNLCRCTGYVKIFDAVRDAAESLEVE